jgi:hypothetical protein
VLFESPVQESEALLFIDALIRAAILADRGSSIANFINGNNISTVCTGQNFGVRHSINCFCFDAKLTILTSYGQCLPSKALEKKFSTFPYNISTKPPAGGYSLLAAYSSLYLEAYFAYPKH